VAGLSILVAEDNPVNQKLVLAFLKGSDCRVTCVDNGREACDALSVDGAAYDVLLLDCHMPVMDGFQAAREIRAGQGRHRSIPILAVTAGAMDDHRSECLAAGMDEVLVKPFNRPQLLAAIADRIVDGDRGRAAAQEPSGAEHRPSDGHPSDGHCRQPSPQGPARDSRPSASSLTLERP